MAQLVFTYGTLMKNQAAYGRFGEVEFVSDGVLHDYGIYEVEEGYPAAVPVKGFSVYGEIYRIKDELLESFDRYELEGDLYIRHLMKIETETGLIDAWFYEYNKDVSGLELRAPVGKWNTVRNPYTKE